MKWARRAILCLTFLVAALALASAIDPASGPQASLSASPSSSASGPVEIGLDVAAPGTIVGRKVVYGMADNAKVVYKYIRVPRPLRETLAAMADADAARAGAEGTSLAEAEAETEADSELDSGAEADAEAEGELEAGAEGERKRKRRRRSSKSKSARKAKSGSAGARDPKLATVPSPKTGPAPSNSTLANVAPAAPTVPGLNSEQTAKLDAALTSDLRFSRTAFALVLLTAVAVGTSMGVAVFRYSYFKKKADDSVRRFKAFAVV